jgi:hypothetical protein
MTSRLHLLRTEGLLTCAITAILTATAHADVTLEERMSVSGVGLMKMANMSGTTVTTIAGDRARADSTLQFESGLVRTFARGVGGPSTQIVRLDQDKIYMLDPGKKTYTEVSFADQRAQMQQAMEQSRQAQASQQQAASGVDESQCEWSEPKADVIRSGEKASFAGYEGERVTITATQSCKDKKTGQVCDFGLLFDQWLAPNFEAAEEALAYQRAYAEKLGFGASASRDFAERAETMFGRYQGLWKEVSAKMRDVKGYPVKASFGLGVGGPQCQSAQEMQAAGGSSSPSTSPPASIGGAIGGAVGGALGGLFGKKKEPAQAAPAPTAAPATMPGGLIPLMTISTELVSVNRGPANPQSFEVPADFKKQ